ncbi:Flap endonuclease 1-A [Clarias magur]|uniref:Flap endonuclease 1-A n=1 Tax=Clarias magur TaxID=1594786 RepID=A0A8J4UNI4_CLAMG|nr:Flap endonuclease 1-A [Clarias magur]
MDTQCSCLSHPECISLVYLIATQQLSSISIGAPRTRQLALSIPLTANSLLLRYE